MSDPASSGSLRQRRPSSTAADAAADAAKGLLSTAKAIETKVEETLIRLVGWDDLAPWRRDNAFLLTGYRPDSNSYAASFGSLGYLHNETVNIWSHLLGALFFLACGLFLYREVVPRYDTASAADLLVFACFFGGAVACLGMSATYHALSNHSPAVAKWGNKLDYTGIIFLIIGSYVPALYYGFFCSPDLLTVYLSVITLLGMGCGAVSWLERFRTPEWRALRTTMFVCFGLSGVVPVIHGISAFGRETLEQRMSLNLLFLHGAMYVFGAFLYVFRWPERSYPRRFDIWGSSHQIFHMFVVMAALTHLYGMGKAFDYRHSVGGLQC